ncbi:MAG TPA: hypothetical protein VLE73_01270 [Candidatus Saccharimonadales bacterium]|nr:hypothetical protein [Candidatus Saccharimonadales bacterium]
MLFKKKQPTPAKGRVRPDLPPDRRPVSQVFSYHANRSTAGAADGARRAGTEAHNTAGSAVQERLPRRSGLKRAGRVLVALTLLVLAVLNLIVSPTPKLRTPTGGSAADALFIHPKESYAEGAADVLGDSPMNRTKLTIDAKKTASELSRRFPELGSVIVSVPFIGQQPTVYIEPATPALLLATTEGTVYVVDTNGKVLARLGDAPTVTSLGLPTVSDPSGLQLELGRVALPSTNVSFITEVVGQLKAKHLTVRSLVLPARTSELWMQVQGTSYTIKYNLHGDAREEAGAYLAVKQQLDKEKKTPTEYVDVRVEGRAYFK